MHRVSRLAVVAALADDCCDDDDDCWLPLDEDDD